MKKIVSVVAVSMFLCAGSALAIPAGGNLEIQAPGGIKGNLSVEGSKMEGVTNETTVKDSKINNVGENAELNVGTISNTSGGSMTDVHNTTTIESSQINNVGENAKANIGVIKQ